MHRKIFLVAAAYCGAVIGAGFATGREVVNFFGIYGNKGVLGVALAALLFMWAGVVILDVTHQNTVYSYLDLLRYVLHFRVLIVAADVMFLWTLLTGIGVMTAAGGTILSGWGIWYPGGCALFLCICIVILHRGSSGFIRANSWLVPGMILIMAGLCIVQISSHAVSAFSAGPYRSSVLYVAFNTAIAAVALSTLKKQLDPRVVLGGGIGGGLLIGGLLFLVYFATSGLPGQAEIPMLELANLWLGRWEWIYDFVLLVAVLTTALANMHGLTSRVAAEKRYWLVLVLLAGMGLFLAQFGFARLVAFLYPLLGFCNIVLLAGLCYYSFTRIKFLIRSR